MYHCAKILIIIFNFSQFKLNSDFTQAFVMRFNENVDKKHQLVLNNNENAEQTLAALKTIPYNGKGS